MYLYVCVSNKNLVNQFHLGGKLGFQLPRYSEQNVLSHLLNHRNQHENFFSFSPCNFKSSRLRVMSRSVISFFLQVKKVKPDALFSIASQFCQFASMSILFLNLSTMDFLLPRKIFPIKCTTTTDSFPFALFFLPPLLRPPLPFLFLLPPPPPPPLFRHIREGKKSSSLEKSGHDIQSTTTMHEGKVWDSTALSIPQNIFLKTIELLL